METKYLPHEQRMIKEREELEPRLINLNTFLSKSQPENIDETEWDLLNAQAFAMRSYNHILSVRIKRFKSKYKEG